MDRLRAGALKAARHNRTSSGRIPASTIRAIRRFHGRDQRQLAAAFQVSERTVIRWEKRGIHPDLLPVQAGVRDPDWRKKLLIWMHNRYLATASPDNRPQEATSLS